MNALGLSSLLATISTDDFLDKYWPNEPFATHEDNPRLRAILDFPFFSSLDALLKTWNGAVQVHLPDISDESSSVDAVPNDAKKLFENGMALLFNNAHKLSPRLTDLLHAIKKDLGLPTSTFGRCMVYATPDGKGTRAHFDQNINFVVQLYGIKKWWISPNSHIENPTERFTIGQPLDPELASYVQNDMPTVMPTEDQQEIVLKPGSVLFVPRGYWHRTEASGEALALNFTFSQPTYVDLFTAALRSRLNLSSDWRELADGVTSVDPERRELAEQKFDFLLTELIKDIPHWKARDILNATEHKVL